MVAPTVPPSGFDHRELPLVFVQTQGVLMQGLSHLASFAFGAFIGSLLMAMVVSDDSAKLADAIIGLSTIMREDMVMLPVSKAEKRK